MKKGEKGGGGEGKEEGKGKHREGLLHRAFLDRRVTPKARCETQVHYDKRDW